MTYTYLFIVIGAASVAATTAANIVNAFEWSGQPAKIAPSLGGYAPHIMHGSLGPPESPSKTASRLVQPFSYGSQTLCYTMHCRREKKQNCPFPMGFHHPDTGGPSHSDKQRA